MNMNKFLKRKKWNKNEWLRLTKSVTRIPLINFNLKYFLSFGLILSRKRLSSFIQYFLPFPSISSTGKRTVIKTKKQKIHPASNKLKHFSWLPSVINRCCRPAKGYAGRGGCNEGFPNSMKCFSFRAYDQWIWKSLSPSKPKPNDGMRLRNDRLLTRLEHYSTYLNTYSNQQVSDTENLHLYKGNKSSPCHMRAVTWHIRHEMAKSTFRITDQSLTSSLTSNTQFIQIH